MPDKPFLVLRSTSKQAYYYAMQDDAVLVDAFRNGDNRAFETLYARHVRSVYDFVYVRTHHRATAEDIVSQTFLQALERIGSFDASRGNFAGWIHRIARNLIVDHYRRLHPSSDIEGAWDLPSGADTAAEASASIRATEIRSLLQGLTLKQRETVLLRVWHGRSFAEIAQILDSTEAACKMTYKRAIDSIRNALLIVCLFFSLLSYYA